MNRGAVLFAFAWLCVQVIFFGCSCSSNSEPQPVEQLASKTPRPPNQEAAVIKSLNPINKN
jgi:hypothetical protein